MPVQNFEDFEKNVVNEGVKLGDFTMSSMQVDDVFFLYDDVYDDMRSHIEHGIYIDAGGAKYNQFILDGEAAKNNALRDAIFKFITSINFVADVQDKGSERIIMASHKFVDLADSLGVSAISQLSPNEVAIGWDDLPIYLSEMNAVAAKWKAKDTTTKKLHIYVDGKPLHVIIDIK